MKYIRRWITPLSTTLWRAVCRKAGGGLKATFERSARGCKTLQRLSKKYDDGDSGKWGRLKMTRSLSLTYLTRVDGRCKKERGCTERRDVCESWDPIANPNQPSYLILKATYIIAEKRPVRLFPRVPARR